MQRSTATTEHSVEIPYKTGNKTAIWPSNPTDGYTHQGNQNWKRHVYPNIHHSTVYTRRWKQPRYPLADEWIGKLWNIYIMGYYSTIKKNTFESVLMRWMKLEPIIQSEVSQKGKKPIQYINTYIWNLERWQWLPYMWDSKRDTHAKNRLSDCLGEGKDGMIWDNSIETCLLPYVK